MNKTAAQMSRRIQRALQSGKLDRTITYSIPALAGVLGTTRSELSAAAK